MEGTLLKKTTTGQWHSRNFTLVGTSLTWLKSDNKTTLTVDVSKATEVRDIKVGPKRFCFEVVLPGDNITVSASGEAEKAAWMAALKLAMGKREEADGILQKSGAGRMSVRSPAKPMVLPGKPGIPPPGASAPKSPLGASAAKPVVPAAAAKSTPAVPAATAPAAAPAAAVAASPAPTPAPAAVATPVSAAPAVPAAGGSLVGGLSEAANARLQAKLGGKVNVPQQTTCVVCGQTVYKPEELIVDKAKMHKRCFQCAHCKRLLTMGNFACINGTFYCKVHYFELFATNGGKYDAFGDAGFKTKATTAYTPGDILKPGSMNKNLAGVSANKTAKPAAAVPAAVAEPAEGTPAPTPMVAPESTSKPAVASPKKLEVKVPVSTKTVEKTAVDVVPKKNMDDLRKMVVLPGMQPPKPKKEQAVVEEPAAVGASPVVAPEDQKEGEANSESKDASEVAAPEATAAASEEGEKPPEGGSEPEEKPAAEEAAAAAPQPEKVAVVEEPPPIQIVRPPAGVNFALEAMKVRQAQLMKQGVAPPQPEETLASREENRNSIRVAGKLDHSAVLSKPRMAGRRAPKVQEVGKLLPKAEVDRFTHDWTFRVLINGTQADVLVVHATSQFEKEHWVATLSANVYMLGLKRDLEMAQKKDMMSALQAQINLETFSNDNKITYSGFLEKVSMKSQRNWKKRWFELNDKGELLYFENENSKKPKQTLQLSHLTVITSADGTRLDAPLVINTGGAQDHGTDESGQLPQNIAIFDNEDVTIDLETIIPDELKSAPAEAEPSSPAPVETESVKAEEKAEADYVVVETAEATPAPQEPASPKEAPASPSSPTAASEAPAEAAEPVVEEEKRINTAWAVPGKAPDRVGQDETPLKEAPAAPSPMADEAGRRKSAQGKDKKGCVIM